MNSDIRLSIDFFTHPKTIKLRRRLGSDGVLALIRLWLFAARHKCDGRLTDMDTEDIAIVADFNESLTVRSSLVNDSLTGKTTNPPFVDTLVELHWLDLVDGVYCLHGWLEHNGWASSADDRSDKSRFSRMAYTYPDLYKSLKEQGYSAISADEFKKLTAPLRVKNIDSIAKNVDLVVNGITTVVNESLTTPLSPSPSPSPSYRNCVSSKRKRQTPPSGDHALFISWWYMAFEKVCGLKPTIDGKAGNLIKHMVKNVDSVYRLALYASVVLTSGEEFYTKSGRTLGVLSAQLDAFKSRHNNYEMAEWRSLGIMPPEGVKFEDWEFWKEDVNETKSAASK